MKSLQRRAIDARLSNPVEQDLGPDICRAGKVPPLMLPHCERKRPIQRSNWSRLQLVGFVSVFALLGGPETARGAVGDCLDNQYRLCMGDCPQGTTDQGECTTRIEQTPPARWCCCSDTFPPGGGETTPAPPSDSDANCADISIPGETDNTSNGTNGDDKDEPASGWAASSAVSKTTNPLLTDNVLSDVRDNVLLKNERTKKYVRLVYTHAKEIEQILINNPKLVTQSAALLDRNLQLLTQIGKGQQVTVESEKIQRVSALLDEFAKSPGASDELKRAIANVKDDLANKKLLKLLGVSVAK